MTTVHSRDPSARRRSSPGFVDGPYNEMPSAAELDRRPSRAIVIEDDLLIAMDLAAILESQGFAEVTTAISIAEAEAALAAHHYDVALLDVSMGPVSSESLLPLLGESVVIVVTGHSPAQMPPVFATLPILAKPFRTEHVAIMLRDFARP